MNAENVHSSGHSPVSHISTYSVHSVLSTCLRFVQLQSNFHQLLTGYIADVAGTFKSLI